MSGKQREIMERDKRFLQVARELLRSEGYQGINIARIAQITGFSRRTVYLRFPSKEELVVTLGIECRASLHRSMEHAAAFQGRPRERIVALCESVGYYARNHHEDLRIIKLIETEAILDKVGAELRDEMSAYDERVFKIVLDIIQDGIAQGDLELQGECSAESLALALWVMTDGTIGAVLGGAPLHAIGISDPFKELGLHAQFFMDGFGWRPLYRDWDYAGTLERARELVSSKRALDDDGYEAAQGNHVLSSQVPGARLVPADAESTGSG